MRDPLLEQSEGYLARRRRLRDVAVVQWHEFPDAPTLTADLAEWCRGAFKTASLPQRPGSRLRLIRRLALHDVPLFGTREPALDLDQLRDSFDAMLGRVEHDGHPLASWMLGHAMARLAIDELAAGRAQRHLLSLDFADADLAYDAFHESLKAQLADIPLARATLLRFLREHVAAICREPGIATAPHEKDDFEAYVRQWAANPDLDRLWRGQGHWFPTHYGDLKLAIDLLASDRSAVLESLDMIRYPQPLEDLFTHFDIRHDRDEIAACLRDAPPASDDGMSWSGSHLAPLLLRVVDRHAEELWRVAAATDNPSDVSRTRTTLAEWFRHLAHVVMQRPDGRFLGTQWLLLKLADERLNRRLPASSGDTAGAPEPHLPFGTLLWWIVSALAAAGLSPKDVADQVGFPTPNPLAEPSPEPPPSIPDEAIEPCLRGLCAMELLESADESADHDPTLLLAMLDSLLRTRHPALEVELASATTAHDLPASRCGLLLARLDNPTLRWRTSWHALGEQRRRVQHWQQNNDGDAFAPSYFLLSMGVAAIDWMRSLRQSSSSTLWRELFDAARECWLTMSETHLSRHVETQIQHLFSRHPLVFGDPPIEVADDGGQPSVARLYAATLARDLAMLGGDATMLAICYLKARNNGVGPRTMDAVRRHNSGHVESLLRQFERWQSLERPERKLPGVLDQIRRDLPAITSSPR